jgi:transcription antitermination factor NusG
MRETEWVVLELSTKGEEEALVGKLKSRIISSTCFKDSDVYIPIIRQPYGKPIWLMEGYIFIKCGYGATEYYSLKQNKLIKSIISQYDTQSGMISIGVIPDSELKLMLKKVDDLGGSFKPKDIVRLKEGAFEGFEGEIITTWVLKDGMRMYSVFLTFRSVDLLLSVTCLSVEGV